MDANVLQRVLSVVTLTRGVRLVLGPHQNGVSRRSRNNLNVIGSRTGNVELWPLQIAVQIIHIHQAIVLRVREHLSILPRHQITGSVVRPDVLRRHRTEYEPIEPAIVDSVVFLGHSIDLGKWRQFGLDLQLRLFEIASFKHLDYVNCNLSSGELFFQIKFYGNGTFLRLVVPVKLRDGLALGGVPDPKVVFVRILKVLFASDQVGVHGAPLEGGNALAVYLEQHSLVWNVHYVDSILVNDCEFLSVLRRELSDFGSGVLRKVLLAFERLDLVGVAAVELVQEGTLIGERYKLQLREGLMLLVLVRLRRLLGIVCKLIYLFLELLLMLLRV